MTAPIEIEGCHGLRARMCPEPAVVWEALETAEGVRLGPPFWAHAWPGGVALAQWVTLHPEVVRGKRVLDFASGGGVSAIAALRAGAASVLATELDVWAREAIIENANLNAFGERVGERVEGAQSSLSVTGDDVTSRDDGWDVVLVGDVFYESEPARVILAWISRLRARGAVVLIGDPGRSFLPQSELRCVHTSTIPPVPAWDSVLDRPARVWELK